MEESTSFFMRLLPKTSLFRKGKAPVWKSIIKINRECAICLNDKIENPRKLSCGHYYCLDCLKIWMEKKNTCPLCREEIKSRYCL